MDDQLTKPTSVWMTDLTPVISRFVKFSSWPMVLVGLGLFARSLWLPAVSASIFENNQYATYSGLECLAFGVYWYPSNALLILSPVMRLVAGLHWIAWVVIATLYSLSTAVVSIVFWSDPQHCLAGTYYWAGAHVLVTLAMWAAIPWSMTKADR